MYIIKVTEKFPVATGMLYVINKPLIVGITQNHAESFIIHLFPKKY
jgi:hypothetical protein